MGNLAVKFGLIGSTLGMLAGLIELTVGAQIRSWIGNKENPVVLGLVTLLLSTVALGSIVSARNPGTLTNEGKLTIFLGIVLPAGICFTTVGRLWYLPGSLLLIAALHLAHQYWTGVSSNDFHIACRLMAGFGGGIVLAAIGLAFWQNQIGLFQFESFVNAERILCNIVPMDLVRCTHWSASVPTVKDTEVTRVMIIYIILLLGATTAILASLTASRFFTRLGSFIIFIGLILFIFWLPGILAQAHYVSAGYSIIIRSLGWGWFISAFGTSLIMIASLLRLSSG